MNALPKLIALIVLLAVQPLQAKFITLTVGGGKTNDSVSIGSNEVAVIKYYYPDPSFKMDILRDGLTNLYLAVNAVIAGPATFRFSTPNESFGQFHFTTLEIIPESFPPDKTLIIPEGTGANVILECSTNLIHWEPASPGTYTNGPSKFFRLRADRLPLPP